MTKEQLEAVENYRKMVEARRTATSMEPAFPNEVSHNNGPSLGGAAVLSFLCPGLGQLYRGSFGSAFCWFVVTFIGYFAFIAPGLVLHLCCIVSAGSK